MNDAPVKTKVAVIVLTYNGEDYVDKCLSSLRHVYDSDDYEPRVIVVDNASEDRTKEIVRERYPSARLIEGGVNAGFAEGNNIGMRAALEWGADYVYLLNQDASASVGFLSEALKVAESDKKTGSVQSLILLEPDRNLINSSGNAIHFLGLGYSMDYRRPLEEWKNEGVKEIAYASGAGVLYASGALGEVGLFDGDLFLYHEDLDLGWRMRIAGYKNVLAPDSRVYHQYEFSKSITKYYYMERNRYIVLFKNFRTWTLVLLFPFLLASEIALFVISLCSGWYREKVRVYGHFLKRDTWRHIRRERAKTAQTRRAGDREIIRLFTPVIAFQDVVGPFTRYAANPLMVVTWSILRLFII